MIFLLIRLLVVCAIFYGVYHVVQFGVKTIAQKNACPRCDGYGYWDGVRGKEKCDACGGSGKKKNLL